MNTQRCRVHILPDHETMSTDNVEAILESSGYLVEKRRNELTEKSVPAWTPGTMNTKMANVKMGDKAVVLVLQLALSCVRR